MESLDTRRSASVIYAVLSLLVRLFASQCSAFNLWFSRRCYERSRGEMIMMLSEKILTRKVAAFPKQSQEVMSSDRKNNGGTRITTKGPRSRLRFIWHGLNVAMNGVFRTFRTTGERLCTLKSPASSTYLHFPFLDYSVRIGISVGISLLCRRLSKGLDKFFSIGNTDSNL